jgi:hypothetical protein
MIEIWRQGRNGNLLEKDGPVLWVNFSSDEVLDNLFKGITSTYRYMELRRGIVSGFAPEDKVHIRPVALKEVEAGVTNNVGLSMDPGGDMSIKLSTEAGKDVPFSSVVNSLNTFSIPDISDTPEGFQERNLDTLILVGLHWIEHTRRSRERAISNMGTAQ